MRFRQAFQEDFLTISNALSLARVMLLPPFVCVSLDYSEGPSGGRLALIFGLAILAVLTDFFDGFFARLLHQETIIGRYLDPICDKVVILGAFSVLVLYFNFPIWLYAFYLIREILGIWLGTFLYFRRDRQARPNFFGKIGVGLASLLSIWYVSLPYLSSRLAGDSPALNPLPVVWAFVAVQVLGMLAYARTYGKIVLERNKPRE